MRQCLLDCRQGAQIGDQCRHVVGGDVLVRGKRRKWEGLVRTAIMQTRHDLIRLVVGPIQMAEGTISPDVSHGGGTVQPRLSERLREPHRILGKRHLTSLELLAVDQPARAVSAGADTERGDRRVERCFSGHSAIRTLG